MLDFGSVHTDLLIKKLHHVVDDVSHPLHDRLSGQVIIRSGSMRLQSGVTNYIFIASFQRQFGNKMPIMMLRLKCSCMLYYIVFEHSCHFHFGRNKSFAWHMLSTYHFYPVNTNVSSTYLCFPSLLVGPGGLGGRHVPVCLVDLLDLYYQH